MAKQSAAKKQSSLGISDLAKETKLKEATLRGKLRKAKHKKAASGVYSWPNQAALKKTAQQLTA